MINSNFPVAKKKDLSVQGRYENIKTVCDFVTDGAKQVGMSDSDVFHIELACDEACTNVIEHAYCGEGKGEIFVSWEATADHFIVIIQDNGRPFEPKKIPTPPDEPASFENLKIGGLGLHFMKKLMDDVDFKFDSSGNTLIMKKERH